MSRAPNQIKLMVLLNGTDQAGTSQVVETALTMAFQNCGYSVLDAAVVAQIQRRHAVLLQRYEIEAAKRLGERSEADIVVTGTFTSRVIDKTYDMLGGKKVTVSQADVSAKMIWVNTGKVLVAESASVRKPFDTTGAPALQAAAEALAEKLCRGLKAFLMRDTIDYHLFVLNLNNTESRAMQAAMRNNLAGVTQVRERGFSQGALELEVSVARQHDETFKQSLFTPFAAPALGRFEMIAWEGDTVYLRRIVSRIPEPPETRPMYNPGYRKSWAVVIGINNYPKWPKLAFAVADAQAMADLLKQWGFDEVILLLDGEATQQKILWTLGDGLAKKAETDDRVVIFYAGHGQTEDLANGSKMGYIIPYEGEPDNYYSTAISMSQLQQLSDRLRAKHILYLMDSCFSGLLLHLRGDSTRGSDVMKQTTFPARQVLTAGGEGEMAMELEGHGLFTRILLEGLRDKAADANGDGHITAHELSHFVTPRVSQAAQAQGRAQNPSFGRLGTGQGEVLF